MYVPWDVSPCWVTARLLPQIRNDDGNRVVQPHWPLARRLAATGPQQAVDPTDAIQEWLSMLVLSGVAFPIDMPPEPA